MGLAERDRHDKVHFGAVWELGQRWSGVWMATFWYCVIQVSLHVQPSYHLWGRTDSLHHKCYPEINFFPRKS